jgi:uncharacterized integral membrane protein
MRFGTVLLMVTATLTAAFLVINWSVFAAPARFGFLFGSVDIPIGLVMLAVFALTVLAFSILAVFWQGTVLKDYRRQSKELQTQRKLADDAEASRFTELRTLLSTEMSALAARTEAALEALRSELHDTEHSIAATLGEMDDRMKRTTNGNVD